MLTYQNHHWCVQSTHTARARFATFLLFLLPVTGSGVLVSMSSMTGVAHSLSTAITARSDLFSLPLPTSLLIMAGALVVWAASMPLAVRFHEARDL